MVELTRTLLFARTTTHMQTGMMWSKQHDLFYANYVKLHPLFCRQESFEDEVGLAPWQSELKRTGKVIPIELE